MAEDDKTPLPPPPKIEPNGPRIRQLRSSLAECEQTKSMPVSVYYGKLQAIWHELDHHEPLISCACCSSCTAGRLHEQQREQSRLHDFLMGLYSGFYSFLRINILSQDPLPSLDRAYQLVVQDERVRKTIQESFSSLIYQQGIERKILVRSVNHTDEKVQCQNEDNGNMIEKIFRRDEFHLVDLKLDKIYHNCLPSPQRAAGVGEMVAMGQSIFIFGGRNNVSPLSDSELHYYIGASHLHFGSINSMIDNSINRVGVVGTWGSAPINDLSEFIYTCLNGDVYCFGNVGSVPKVLRVDTNGVATLCSWKSLGPLPSKLVDCSAYMPVIPDPTNNRILVHLNDNQLSSSYLYAFYPPTQGSTCAATWKCLDSNFSDWNRVLDAVLVDGVLYLHVRKLPNLVRAYEVANGKWLDVQWSTRVIDEAFSVDDYTYGFDKLFCLDDTNKILCLADYSLIVPDGDRCDCSLPTNTTLLFLKFKAERCGSTITLTPLYTRSYEISSTYQVLDFVPL